jgi:endoglucanase
MLLRPLLAFAAFTSAVALSPNAVAADTDVRLNSVGYVPLRAKLATIAQPGTTFDVVRESDGSVALSGALTGPVNDADTGEALYVADFSQLAEPGSYHLEVPGVGRSVTFAVDGNAYQNAFATSMLGFYGWRCGTDVSFDYAGTHFGYPACHLQDAHTEPLGGMGTRDGNGGWHDAGDYGKYTVNAALTLGMLLAAFEDYGPALAQVKLQIPESGGALPDFLAEVKWELSWLMKMQYSATDGRVSHKITEATHPGFIMPQADTAARSFVPYGTAATADFVAALAKAARIYRSYDPAFADQCLAAATVSYQYLKDNPTNVAANETGFISTQYSSNDDDDRIWASAEYWVTTGDAAALADFESRILTRPDKVSSDFDWGNLTNLGVFAYLAAPGEGRNPGLVTTLQKALTTAADQLVQNQKTGGYGRALGNYYWGVNGSLARTCMVLMHANAVAGNSAYVDACSDQLAFLFGRNPFSRSFVTGLGQNPPMHPHHRPSAADGIEAPYPGLLVGGGWAYRALDGSPPISACALPVGLCWSDEQANYQVNEVAINWNAALVYALASFLGGGPAIATGTGALGMGGMGSAGMGSGGAATAGAGAGGAVPGAEPLGSKGGCGCKTAASRSTSTGAALFGLLLSASALRRRARRNAAPRQPDPRST